MCRMHVGTYNMQCKKAQIYTSWAYKRCRRRLKQLWINASCITPHGAYSAPARSEAELPRHDEPRHDRAAPTARIGSGHLQLDPRARRHLPSIAEYQRVPLVVPAVVYLPEVHGDVDVAVAGPVALPVEQRELQPRIRKARARRLKIRAGVPRGLGRTRPACGSCSTSNVTCSALKTRTWKPASP